MDLVNGLGGVAGFGENTVPEEDDGSIRIDLSPVFPQGLNFFGARHTELNINTNGNITFGGPFFSYQPRDISTFGGSGIFPFWTDIDISNNPSVVPSPGGTSQGTNAIYYDLDPVAGTFTVTWDDVVPFGFFPRAADGPVEAPVNAFQVILTALTDATGERSGDFAAEFRYEAIDWTSGLIGASDQFLFGDAARIGYVAGDADGTIGQIAASGISEALLLLDEIEPLRFTSRAGEISGGGGVRVLRGTETAEEIAGTATPEAIIAGSGDDTVRSGAGPDVINLGDGANLLIGTAEDHFGDRILGATRNDRMIFEGATFSRDDIQIDAAARRAWIDLDQDSVLDGFVEVDVQLRGGNLLVLTTDGDTSISFAPHFPDLSPDRSVSSRDVNGIASADYLRGVDGVDFSVTLRDTGAEVTEAAFGVYEVDDAGNLVNARILIADPGADPTAEAVVTGVAPGHALGFFLLETETPLPVEGSSDSFSFVNQLGEAANLDDSNYIFAAVDGAIIAGEIQHSISGDLNHDLRTHVVSGVEAGTEGLMIGFEDSFGPGGDFDDLIFNVQRIAAEEV